MSTVRKSLVAASGVIVLIVGTELGEGSKWYTYVVAALVAAGVYTVPNRGA